MPITHLLSNIVTQKGPHDTSDILLLLGVGCAVESLFLKAKAFRTSRELEPKVILSPQSIVIISGLDT